MYIFVYILIVYVLEIKYSSKKLMYSALLEFSSVGYFFLIHRMKIFNKLFTSVIQIKIRKLKFVNLIMPTLLKTL